MKRSLATFDLDDTIIDTSDVVYKAFNDALNDKGVDSISKEKYNEINFWSGDSKSALREIGIEDSPEEFLEHYDVFFKKATASYIDKGKIRKYPEAEKVIESFKKDFGSIAIVTNSPHEVATLKLERLDLAPHFDHVFTPKHVVEKKPSPEGILKAIERSESSKSQTVHIGDSSNDVAAANSAGVKSVKLGSTHEKADYSVSELRELTRLEIDFRSGFNHK